MDTVSVSFLIGQALGVVAVILGFINYQVKTREQVLYVHIATTICFGLHYMLIGAYAGMAMNFVGAIRNVVYYFACRNGKSGRPWAITFSVIIGAIGVLSWEAWYSVFVVLGLIINSYAMSFSNPQNVRKSILVSSPLVLTYDAFALSFGGMVYEVVVIVSSIIGLARYKNKREIDLDEEGLR